jgi:hypothetical protein
MYGIRPVAGKDQRHLGWTVMFIRNGESYQKHFANSLHGGPKKALAAAKAWRNKMSRNVPCITKADLATILRRHNTSGYPGVYLMATTRKTDVGQRKCWMWQARTPEDVKPQRTKSFAIARYGNEQAFAMAVAARQEFVRELGDRQLMRVIPKDLRPRPESLGPRSAAQSTGGHCS